MSYYAILNLYKSSVTKEETLTQTTQELLVIESKDPADISRNMSTVTLPRVH